MKFGYCRVSSTDQCLNRQIDALRELGIDEANIFCDKISGVKEHRPALDDLLSRLREGDSVTVLSFDRLARSTKQLLALSEKLNAMGVDLISIKENIDTTSPQGKLIFSILASIAEFQRSIIKEAQREGIEAAKKRGKMNGRPKVKKETLDAAIALYLNGTSVRDIEKTVSISRGTLYKELKKRGVSRNDSNTVIEFD